MRTILGNKKGVLGLDTVKAVVLALAMIAILVVVMFAVILPLQNAQESIDTNTKFVGNETVPIANTSGYVALQGQSLYRNCIASGFTVTNQSNGEILNTANYSTSACSIKLIASGNYNLTNWNVSYTASYDSWNTYNIVANTTVGPLNLFQNSGTFFVLLGVVVLILIISMVIVAVSRFSGGGIGTGKRGEQSEGI